MPFWVTFGVSHGAIVTAAPSQRSAEQPPAPGQEGEVVAPRIKLTEEPALRKKSSKVLLSALTAMIPVGAVVVAWFLLGVTLTISSEPHEATILIDGAEVEKTSTQTGQATIRGVPRGRHALRIHHEGFLAWSQPLELRWTDFSRSLSVKLTTLAVQDPAKTRDEQRLFGLQQIQSALDVYYVRHDAYPSTPTYLVIEGLLPAAPTAPAPRARGRSCALVGYCYAALGSGCTSYHLGVMLEDSANVALSSDSDAPVTFRNDCAGVPDFNGASTDCGPIGSALDRCYDVKFSEGRLVVAAGVR